MTFLQHYTKHPTGQLLAFRLSKLIMIVKLEQERTLSVKKDCWRHQMLISSMNKDRIIHTSMSIRLYRLNVVT